VPISEDYQREERIKRLRRMVTAGQAHLLYLATPYRAPERGSAVRRPAADSPQSNSRLMLLQ